MLSRLNRALQTSRYGTCIRTLLANFVISVGGHIAHIVIPPSIFNYSRRPHHVPYYPLTLGRTQLVARAP